eukprot:EG_transcript_24988
MESAHSECRSLQDILFKNAKQRRIFDQRVTSTHRELLLKRMPSKRRPKKRRRKIWVSSRRLRRRPQFFQPEKENRRHDVFLPLHQLWKEYTAEELQRTSFAQHILKGALHGAEVRVVESRQASLVGVRGLILDETPRTFMIITAEDKLKVLPKAQSVFAIQYEGKVATLPGLSRGWKQQSKYHSNSSLPPQTSSENIPFNADLAPEARAT